MTANSSKRRSWHAEALFIIDVYRMTSQRAAPRGRGGAAGWPSASPATSLSTPFDFSDDLRLPAGMTRQRQRRALCHGTPPLTSVATWPAQLRAGTPSRRLPPGPRHRRGDIPHPRVGRARRRTRSSRGRLRRVRVAGSHRARCDARGRRRHRHRLLRAPRAGRTRARPARARAQRPHQEWCAAEQHGRAEPSSAMRWRSCHRMPNVAHAD